MTTATLRLTDTRSPLAAPAVRRWQRISRCPRRLASWTGWAPEVFGFLPADGDEALEALGLFGDRTDDRADQRLAALVRYAAHDEWAAELTLHRLLVALVSIARRRGGHHPAGHRGAFDELMAAAWIVIRTYPIDRRPSHVAAGLLREIEYQTFVRDARRHRSFRECSVDPVTMTEPASPVPHPMDTVVELIADARAAGAETADLQFAFAWAAGASGRELATRFSMSERTVRNRRGEVAGRIRLALARSAA